MTPLTETLASPFGARVIEEVGEHLRTERWRIDDLKDPNNELPAQLRAGIISIGVWMMKEIDRVRGGVTNDLTPMIEINVLIRNGLK